MVKPIWPEHIRPNNNTGFRIRFRYQGKVFQTTVPGQHASKSDLQAAIRERNRIMSCLQQGVDPFDTPEESLRTSSTFNEDAQEYMHLINVEYATAMDYEVRLNRHWMPLFTGRNSGTITHSEIQRYLNTLSVTEKTKRNLLIPLRGVFESAGVHPNPVDRVKLRKHQKEPVQRFTPAERDAILSQLQGQVHLYFAIAFGTGIRPSGEMLALQWDDYNGSRIKVHSSVVRRRYKPTTKTHEVRYVQVPIWLRKVLDSHKASVPAGQRWMFINTQGNMCRDADMFNKAWREAFDKEAVKAMGIQYRHPYICRHTRAAQLLSSGVAPAAAAKQLGHSVEMFLNNYSEWIEEYSNAREMERIIGIE